VGVARSLARRPASRRAAQTDRWAGSRRCHRARRRYGTESVGVHRSPVGTPRHRTGWCPASAKVRHPGVVSSACGRMAVTEMSSATLFDELAAPDPAAW